MVYNGLKNGIEIRISFLRMHALKWIHQFSLKSTMEARVQYIIYHVVYVRGGKKETEGEGERERKKDSNPVDGNVTVNPRQDHGWRHPLTHHHLTYPVLSIERSKLHFLLVNIVIIFQTSTVHHRNRQIIQFTTTLHFTNVKIGRQENVENQSRI